LFIQNIFADKSIYVSRYLLNNSGLKNEKKILIYNSLSPDFIQKAKGTFNKNIPNNILMICSLRKYKGVFVFCEIASKLPQFSFTLVVNSTDEEIKTFFKGEVLSENLKIFSHTTDVDSFYRSAHLVLNLSLPDMWIESFGLTALEAMTYGIPVIVPKVGGIAELVDEGIQGYKVDARDMELLITKINQILSDKKNYPLLSANAKKKALFFSYSQFIADIEQVIS
jgi:glycosyltransferase involved in cell wall biosynthesis